MLSNRLPLRLVATWFDAEEVHYDMSSKSWTSINRSIDRALSELRSGSPDPTTAAAAIKSLSSKNRIYGRVEVNFTSLFIIDSGRLLDNHLGAKCYA